MLTAERFLFMERSLTAIFQLAVELMGKDQLTRAEKEFLEMARELEKYIDAGRFH
jgi:hypothetical protein